LNTKLQKQREHQEMTQNLTRIREEAQRRIQEDRDNFNSRQEIERELKEQSKHIQPKKQTKRATAPPPLRLPRNDLLQQKNTLIQSPRQINLQSPRFNSPRDVFLGSPRDLQSPRSVLENAQYGHVNVSIFEPENSLDRDVLHEYVNRCSIDEDLPPVPFVKARRDGEYILGQRKFAVSESDDGPVVRIGGRTIVLIDFIEKQERVEAKKLKALGSAGSLLYLV